MGVPASEVGYTSATTGSGDHEVHRRQVGEKSKRKRQKIKENLIGYKK
jgi:hypothetical protein